MHIEPAVDDYYGYNSILNHQGKRVRRMRRTEASLEKLFHSKIKTHLYSRTPSKKSQLHSLSKNINSLSQRRFCSNNKSGNGNVYSRQRTDIYQSGLRNMRNKDSSHFSQLSSGIKENKIKSIRKTQGQYFMGKQDCKNLNSREGKQIKQTNNLRGSNTNLISNNNSRRTLNKTEKSKTIISPFELQNKSRPQMPDNVSKVTLSNKASKIQMNENCSFISNSRLQHQQIHNKVSFQSNIHQEQFFNHSPHLNSNAQSNNSNLLKQSSVKQPSSISSSSHQTCKISSPHASKIRSRVIIKVQQSVNLEEKGKNRMTKKQTQTTQSNLSQDESSIQESLRSSKSRVISINNAEKVEKNKSNPQNGSFVRENSICEYSAKSISIPAPKIAQSMKMTKKKSIGSYTFNDVVQNIQQHQIRLGSIYLFVDSTKDRYQTSIKLERYQRLCFLMLKKYLLEKNRIIKALKGQQNCFRLTNAQIPTEVLVKHINRQEVRQRLSGFSEQEREISLQVKGEFDKISGKYQRDKFIRLQLARDNFSPEIMRLLMEELTKLYQQLQQEDRENEEIDANEQRIIQIIEIMFLMSELSGRPVKPFELYDENIVHFEQYYSMNYERIMETAEYFQKYV